MIVNSAAKVLLFFELCKKVRLKSVKHGCILHPRSG